MSACLLRALSRSHRAPRIQTALLVLAATVHRSSFIVRKAVSRTGELGRKLRRVRAMWRVFITVFMTVFLAEIGDKTQLATILFAAEQPSNKWIVFAGSASALVLAAAIGVLVGG